MDSILKNIRYGVRMVFKNPGLAAIAIVALTLGIGLTTTMFSIVYGALYRGLPFEEQHRLMHLERNNLSEDIQSMEVTIHDFVDWREQQTSFEGIAAFYTGTVNIAGSEGRPDRYDGAFISADAFRLIRAQAMLGRTFNEGEDRPEAEPVIILGYNAWRDRYGSDPGVVGRVIRMNGEQATIIGVMPEGFAFPIAEEVWVALRMNPLELERGQGYSLEVFGRLKDGVNIDQANAEFAAIARRLELEYPETNEGVGVVIKPYTEEYIGEEPARLLWTMLAAVFGVLLIACANVANLLLARATLRTKEVAVRSALGASRVRVIGQLLTETLVLSALGGLLGLGVGWVGVTLFNRSIVDTDPPFWIDIRIDPIAVLFVVGLVLVSSIIAGIIPAVQSSGANVNEILKDESRGSSSLRIGRFSRGLVVAEIALSFALLIAAGLMIRSVAKLRNIDYGFPTEDIFSARVGLFEGAYPDDPSRVRFFEEVQERLGALPGVREAAISTNLPGLGSGRQSIGIEGTVYERDQDYPLARFSVISPGYFQAFDVSVLQGRDFTVQDREEALAVAIVNQSFVELFFTGESPLGRRFRVGTSDTEEPWLTIVGVVPDLYMGGPDNEYPEGFYVPMAQNVARFMFMIARTEANAMALAPLVRDEIVAIDENLPIYWVRSLAGAIAENSWFYTVFGTLFVVFGAVALFLAAIGLYGVMSFAVSRRTKEVGVRMALGAEGGDVLKLVLKQGLWQLAIGVVLGVGLGVLLARGLQDFLFEVGSLDPLTFVAIAVVLVGTGMLASLVPARRATRVDPMVALRYE
jgi:predicted permease